MKVALSFSGCHRRGGVERIMLECARYLLKRNHEVAVYANQWAKEELQGARLVHVPMRRKPGFLAGASYFENSTRLLKNADFDVLGTHGCVCPVGGVLWVQSVQRAWLDQSRRMRSPLSASRLKQRLNPLHPILLRLEAQHYGARAYSKLIVTTPTVRDDLHKYYGVPFDDVEIVPNGFAPDEFNPANRVRNRAAMRAELGLKAEEVALLFVGNELQRKGYPTILAALRLLQEKRFKLLVVGKSDTVLVRQLATQAGVEDQVIACGTTSEVAKFHAAADVFVLPTQYEAFCLAILEALGSGLPVLTTRVPGAQDAIVEGENGLLLSDPLSGEELAAQLSKLLDETLRSTLAAAAAPSVDQYQWPNVLQRYEQVLERHCRR